MIEHELSPITTKDGLSLHLTQNQPENPLAGLLVIHGFGEHIGRYDHVYEALAKANILAYGIDLRGHGKSEGPRGHAKSYELLLDDIEELMKAFRADHNDLPMFLFGHSMGGNLVANFVAQKKTNELKGFILSSPWLKLAFEPPAWQVKAANLLASIYPKLTMDNNLDANDLSKNKSVAEAYISDPLVNSKISAGLYVSVTKAGDWVQKQPMKIEIPGLIYHGTDDKITNHNATQQFAGKLKEVQWISYENVRHEGHNDEEKGQVIDNLIKWITKMAV